MNTGLDTLKATRALEAAGFETGQAEALVTVLGGPVSGNVATKGDIRDLRGEIKALRSEMGAQIGELRSEMGAQIGELRSEMGVQIGELRSEMGAQIGELRSEMGVQIGRAGEKTEADVRSLANQVADVRLEIKSLKAQMYRLLLVQATVIVGLILGLERLL